jgi:hypothetical protein
MPAAVACPCRKVSLIVLEELRSHNRDRLQAMQGTRPLEPAGIGSGRSPFISPGTRGEEMALRFIDRVMCR